MTGCICALPLTIIGGLSLIVAFPPIDPSKVQDVNWFIHFISTMDWRAPLLTIAIILLDMLLYYPFLKMYEKSLLKHEQAGDLTE